MHVRNIVCHDITNLYVYSNVTSYWTIIMASNGHYIKGGFSYFSLGRGAKNSGGVVMIMCRGGSRIFDDRFTRFTQVIGGPGACPPGKNLKFGALKQHFLRSGVTFKINLMIRNSACF